jgi:hypothetical protein
LKRSDTVIGPHYRIQIARDRAVAASLRLTPYATPCERSCYSLGGIAEFGK